MPRPPLPVLCSSPQITCFSCLSSSPNPKFAIRNPTFFAPRSSIINHQFPLVLSNNVFYVICVLCQLSPMRNQRSTISNIIPLLRLHRIMTTRRLEPPVTFAPTTSYGRLTKAPTPNFSLVRQIFIQTTQKIQQYQQIQEA